MHASQPILLSLSLLGLVAATSTPANAQVEHPLAVEAAVGVNLCADNSSSTDNCASLDPLVYGRLGVHYRLLENMAVGFDIDAGGLGSDNGTVWTLHAIAVIRAMHRVVPRVRIFGGIGLGYGRIQANLDEDNFIRRTTGLEGSSVDAFTIKVPVGGKIRLAKQMWLGLDFAFYAHIAGDACVRQTSGKLCGDVESDNVMHNIQVGLFFAYHL